MKRKIYKKWCMVLCGNVVAMHASQEACAPQKQVASHMPNTLKNLYKQLSIYAKKEKSLHESLSLVQYHPYPDDIEGKRESLTAQLEIVSYQNKFVQKKITQIEQLHYSLPDDKVLNAILHDENSLVILIDKKHEE